MLYSPGNSGDTCPRGTSVCLGVETGDYLDIASSLLAAVCKNNKSDHLFIKLTGSHVYHQFLSKTVNSTCLLFACTELWCTSSFAWHAGATWPRRHTGPLTHTAPLLFHCSHQESLEVWGHLHFTDIYTLLISTLYWSIYGEKKSHIHIWFIWSWITFRAFSNVNIHLYADGCGCNARHQPGHQEQFGVQYLAQGHFDMQTGGTEPATSYNKGLALPLSYRCPDHNSHCCVNVFVPVCACPKLSHE